MGEVEDGIRLTLSESNIDEPKRAYEVIAIALARAFDNDPDEKSIPGISRELRLTLEKIELSHPSTTDDKVDALAKDANNSA